MIGKAARGASAPNQYRGAVTSEPRLVHIVDEVPELDETSVLTLVLVLDGFLDAGSSSALACRHLIAVVADDDGAPVVATFDVDQFHDYRARRPAMSFVRDH